MMKRIILISMVCIFMQTLLAQSPTDVKTFKLDNGLTVWLNEDHTQPSVFGAVVVKAGAKDSPATGIAHYFEHIMFKGTDKIGTTDYQAEKIYLDSIAVKYDLLAQTTNEGERKEIQKEINRLSIAAAQYAIPNEFSTLIAKMGGSGLNAGTAFDQTIYFNSFVPQYIDQWLELNSERLISPVFRLFQSELETVYEEKNMYDDETMSVAFEKLLERAFKPHPYQYPIIGLTEHLKNPSLSDMEKFYKDYYVAGNMGLIISGAFNSESVIPIIKEKFGRLPAGKAPESPVYEIPDIKGKETEQLLIPIPVVKMGFFVWRGVPDGAPEEIKLNAMSKLLSNSSGTGYLSLLGTEGKLLAAEIGSETLKDAGVIFAIIIPKLLFQSYSKAEKLALNEINRIKKGDFTDEQLESVKLEMKREFETILETFNNKAYTMLFVFSQGKEWDDYLKEMETIDKLTRDDIIDVANRYLSDNYLFFTKKTGRYKSEKVKKPDFDPIVPPNKSESSEYAKNLIDQANKTPIVRPRTIDFENDAKMEKITPLVTLYTKE
ncbi:MAG: insulinase family protein, partial [Marinilabiliaceae bacterium]|nr:insulinase family protein [Marinilabiliaceae bacterium]